MKTSSLADWGISPLPFSSIRLNRRPHFYRCPRDWSWKTRLEDFDLWIPLAGRGAITINGKILPITEPTALLLCPGDSIVGEHDPGLPFEVVALHFTPRCRNRNALTAWARRMQAVPLRPAAAWREIAELIVEQLAAEDALARQQAVPLTMTLLSGLWRLAHASVVQTSDECLNALVSAIRREPEREWSLDQMMRDARMGATRLNRRFRELTGHSPTHWVIRCRVERASVLLRDTPMKIAAIAEACGYADVYFFSRQFRQMTGQTPGDWRSGLPLSPPPPPDLERSALNVER